MGVDVAVGEGDIVDSIGDVISRAAAVSDGEYREPGVEEGCVAALGLRRIAPAREPSAADHVEDACAVGRLGLEDVEGQGHAVLVAVDDIGDDFP